jgi:hypothetical protein
MPGASDTLDPIEAARADIAESRNLIASVTDDLSQNQRWFDSYRVSEIRHARRLKRQELMYQLELRRRRLVRFSKRTALSSARDAREAYRTLFAATVATLGFLHRTSLAVGAWVAPRARALGIFLLGHTRARVFWLGVQGRRFGFVCLRAGVAAGAWTAAQARALAQLLARTISRAWSWSARQAPIAWAQAVAAASAGFAWGRANLRALADALRNILSFVSTWIRVELDAVALAAGNTASSIAAWSARRGRRGAVQVVKLSRQVNAVAGDAARVAVASSVSLRQRTASGGRALRDRLGAWAQLASAIQAGNPGLGKGSACRALVVRRSTAVVCVEPWRPRLPTVRAAPSEPRRDPPPGAKPGRRPKPKAKSRPKRSRTSGRRRRSKK